MFYLPDVLTGVDVLSRLTVDGTNNPLKVTVQVYGWTAPGGTMTSTVELIELPVSVTGRILSGLGFHSKPGARDPV